MRIAIVGYHGAGKTTIFRILGGTPNPQPGKGATVNLLNLKVPDYRLERVAQEYCSARITPAEITFVDVDNISAGEKALTDEFLGHARAADALLLVVRAFIDESVYNPREKVNPPRDLQDLSEELILSDLEVVEGRIDKLDKEITRGKKEGVVEREILSRVKERLDECRPLRGVPFKLEEERMLSHFGFMSRKPVVCIVNSNFRTDKKIIDETLQECDNNIMCGLMVPAQLEVELLEIEDHDEKLSFLQSYGYEKLANTNTHG